MTSLKPKPLNRGHLALLVCQLRRRVRPPLVCPFPFRCQAACQLGLASLQLRGALLVHES